MNDTSSQVLGHLTSSQESELQQTGAKATMRVHEQKDGEYVW